MLLVSSVVLGLRKFSKVMYSTRRPKQSYGLALCYLLLVSVRHGCVDYFECLVNITLVVKLVLPSDVGYE